MGGEGVEVDIQRLHVGWAVRHALRAVNHHFRADAVRQRDRLRQIGTAAGDVGHLADRQQPGARVKQRRQQRDIRQAIGADRPFHHLRAARLRRHQPGHQIGVMLRLAHQDLVAGLQPRQ